MPIAFDNVTIGVARAVFRRHESRPNQGQADLPAMSVAREGQRNALRHARKNVRLVREQDDRIVSGDLGQCARQIVDATEAATAEGTGKLIADAREPESFALATEQDR